MDRPDEQAWELMIARCDDGDILLSQGGCPCGCGDEILVRLHRAHFALVAQYMGCVPAADVNKAGERERERLALLAAMVIAHTKDGDPLRIAAKLLMDGSARSAVDESSEGRSSLPENLTPDEAQLSLVV
ncbi:hypothetical protein [Thauera humireducens]|uniref:hypothetical protein n=1 Tax=Thauera humireducens TaxID=1134435 RepID=UPI00311DCFD0